MSYEYWNAVGNCIRRCQPRPVLVLGDFNAHSREWGSPQDNRRGETMVEWAAGMDLRLLNRGSVSTCVRWQGESIIDLSWATPSATHMVSGWRVAEEVVTLSDHRHIVLEVALRPPNRAARRDSSPPRRWALKRLDSDLLKAAAIVAAWPEGRILPDPVREAAWFRATMTSICDASMPRARHTKPRAVYWWSEELARMREACLRARREYQRARRRRRALAEEVDRVYRVYRGATVAFQGAIAEAKARSWDELLEGLDRDPWGRPYKTVLGKLRPWVPPLTETLDPVLVGRVVDTLFPRVQDSPSIPVSLTDPTTWSDDMGVSEEELDRAVKRLRARNTAPGPDGIPGKAWVLALSAGLGDKLRRLFNGCLSGGVFPKEWKEARLVLLKKDGRAAESPSAYRPICLLDEAGKLFERIIAGRLCEHLRQVGPDLSDNQFGFRQARSTVDAILRVRMLSDQVVSRGGRVLAVSLDIVNAFNSLPWRAIRAALEFHGVPLYLQRVVGAYLRDRCVQYMGRDGTLHQREVYCGVPQGSVLGPLLWNLAYDAVLRVELPAGVHVICYADDTLVLAGGDSFDGTKELAELGVARVVDKVHELGLRTAPHKTEALWFHKFPRGREPPSMSVRVGDVDVQVGRYLKYLGLTLDSRWDFGEHFSRSVPRIQKVAGALHRLLPNLGGPRESVRRLYGGVVRSMALYGAPVWSGRLAGVRRNRLRYSSLQRLIAIRIARGYRTISLEAATILARFPPLDILAEMDAQVYVRLRQGAAGEAAPAEVRAQERRRALRRWRERLEEPRCSRQRVVGAIAPVLEDWLGRKSGGNVTYRLTQVLTGHGCFGEYLSRIGREPTAQCHHCGWDLDSAQHTLEHCSAWCEERGILVDRIGQDLSLPTVVATMLADKTAWKAVATFCETVMVQKEAAERDRERADPARRRRRRRGAGNGRPAPPAP